MDFPRAWAIARAVPYEEHEEKCSYRTETGAFLCDCKVLTEHPEYDLPTTPPDPGSGLLMEQFKDDPHWQTVQTELHEEGFFASEQEAIAEEAAWAEQMEAEQAADTEVPLESVAHGHFEIQPSNGVLVVPEDEVDAPVNPLDIPDHYDLPLHGSILACPKCSNDKVKTTWHPHGVLSEPCGTRFGWPNVQNLGEHLCRTCTRCQYGWPEQVFSGA